MKPRSIEEIEAALREMGISDASWGQMPGQELAESAPEKPEPQLFIRIESTTTPLQKKPDVDLA